MTGLFVKGAHARMAMQALAIVERAVELDLGGLWDFPEILYINVAQPAKFGMERAEHGVIRMARVARMIAGNEIVLKMLGRNVTGIIHVQAAAKIVHNVAG